MFRMGGLCVGRKSEGSETQDLQSHIEAAQAGPSVTRQVASQGSLPFCLLASLRICYPVPALPLHRAAIIRRQISQANSNRLKKVPFNSNPRCLAASSSLTRGSQMTCGFFLDRGCQQFETGAQRRGSGGTTRASGLIPT